VLPVIDLPKPSRSLAIYPAKNPLLLKPNIPLDLSVSRETKKSAATLPLEDPRLTNYYLED